MRIYQYHDGQTVKLAVSEGGRLMDPLESLRASRALCPSEIRALSDTLGLIQASELGSRLIKESFALKSDLVAALDIERLKLAAPLTPSTILCSGSNYHEHNKEKANTELSGKEPEFFVKTADCVIGPEESIVHSELFSTKLDGETELAVVIGKAGRHIALEDALDHVYGYTIINDLTARDRQVRFRADGTVWYEIGRSKVFDSSAPLGPCIVTADEIGDPQTLDIKTYVNGELRQYANTSDMIFTAAQLISFFSVNMTLKPGMVIITGTPGGTAWSCDASLGGKWVGGNGIVPAKGYLQPGDVFEAHIEKIGVLRNSVVGL